MELIKPTKELSRLLVTENYCITLPDYDNTEVRLEPIQKAIYLLFLRHAEGIRFKELPDYREELAGTLLIRLTTLLSRSVPG